MIVDTHVHIIDPVRFPMPRDGRGYIPREDEVATADDLSALATTFGVTHQVIVQPSGAGTDNAATLDAVRRDPQRRRAIVACDPQIGEEEITPLRAAGAVGLRLNVVALGRNALEAMRPRLHALAEMGFIIQLECPASILADVAPLLSPEAGPLVLDHLGRPDARLGVDAKGFAASLSLLDRGAILKLSGAFRVSARPYPHEDLDPFVEACKQHAPVENFIWGSDWPFLAAAERPTYRSTLDLLDRWFPGRGDHEKILARNPARLFDFMV